MASSRISPNIYSWSGSYGSTHGLATFLKLLPLGSIIYMISPLDMVIPVIDDIGVLWFFTYLFIELCPEEIVEEHLSEIRSTIEGTVVNDYSDIDENSIEDAQFHPKKE